MVKPPLVPKTTSITPDMSRDWLQQQFGGQRNLREHHARLLAGEMQHGSFVPHNAITFAAVGHTRYLIDGQHRLQAIVLHGKPVTMPVLEIPARDLEEVRQLYISMDQGLKRSATDAIRAMGISDEFGLPERRVQRMSGALRVIATRFTDTTAAGGVARSEAARRRAMTRSNTVNVSLLRAWSTEIHRYYEIVRGGEPWIIELFDRAAVLACALLTIRYVPNQAEQFWRSAALDDGLASTDARKRFTAWLREADRPKSAEIARAFAAAWRHFLRNSAVSFLRTNSRTPLEIERVDLDLVEEELQALVAGIGQEYRESASRGAA